MQINWSTLEPRPGLYDFETYDAIYAADLERGIKPLFIFAFAPRWASDGPCDPAVDSGCHVPPDSSHYDDAARTAAALAKRYPELAAIEIWNEPNTPYFWAPQADPVAYAALLAACYSAIKETDPSMTVAGGSTSNSPGFGPGYVLAPDFVRGVYEAGGADSMDALAVHVYPDPGDAEAQSAIESLREVREVQEELGGEEPIWVTETGSTISGPTPISEAEQALTLLNLYRDLAAEGVEMVLFHTLVAPMRAPEDPETGFGVVANDMSPRSAYCALSDLWDGSVEC